MVMNNVECTSTTQDCNDGQQAEWVASAATGTVFLGAITGQIIMGYLGDAWGRNVTMKFTLAIAAVSALLSALAPQGSAVTVYAVIIVCRFFLGVGLGGVYPLSAVKASEDAAKCGLSEKDQQKAGVKAFFWQTPGSIAPWAVGYVCVYTGNISHASLWRLLLGLGCIPAFFTVLLTTIEMNLPEMHGSPSGQLNSFSDSPRRPEGHWVFSPTPHSDLEHLPSVAMERTASRFSSPTPMRQTMTPRPSRLSIMSTARPTRFEEASVFDLLKRRTTWYCLIATGFTWFLFDICFYGVSLFGGEILKKVNDISDDVPVADYDAVQRTSALEIVALAMGIPGVVVTILAQEFFTTKQIQVTGFLLSAVFFVVMAVVIWEQSSTATMFGVYCGLLFSLSFGANVTTFILSAETYPKRCRSTFSGISSAMGKFGAFVGSYMFKMIADCCGFPTVLLTCCLVSLLAAVLSYVFIGPMGKSGWEDNEGEGEGPIEKNSLKDDPEVQREHICSLREESKENLFAELPSDVRERLLEDSPSTNS
jgi:PHS family inorganic phosphate transporter-like MFS transporter